MAGNNIYRDKGNIVDPDRYITRDIETEVIARLLASNYSTQSIVGMQKVGKSTLAYDCLTDKAYELFEDEKIVVVDMNMAIYEDPEAFLVDIAQKTYNQLELFDGLKGNRLIQVKLDELLKKKIRSNSGQVILQFFEVVKSIMKYRVVCIVDEFDKSRTLFANYKEGFQVLHDLTYIPKNRVAFLFLSRRMVEELEKFVGFDVSNFANVMDTTFLAPYSDKELALYFEKMAETGVTVDDEVKERFVSYTGGYPYWMDKLAEMYVSNPASSIDDLYKSQELDFFKLYEGLLELLKDQGLDRTLYEVVLGPRGEAFVPDKIRALEKYGIIKNMGYGSYDALSKNFRQYLIMNEGTLEFSPMWNRTEKLLKKTICVQFTKAYGDNWSEIVFSKYTAPEYEAKEDAAYKGIADLVREGQDVIDKMIRNTDRFTVSPEKANFIYGGTTTLLAEMIINEYDLFEEVFQMPRKKFARTMYEIIGIRNPYQHNNDDMLNEDYAQDQSQTLDSLYHILEAFNNKN